MQTMATTEVNPLNLNGKYFHKYLTYEYQNGLQICITYKLFSEKEWHVSLKQRC